MYAVINTGGKQLSVKVGDNIQVEKLSADVGSTIEIDRVLAVGSGEDLNFGTPLVEGAKVVCEVTQQGRDKKIIVFKKKRRQGYKLKQGHRQSFTGLKVTEIKV